MSTKAIETRLAGHLFRSRLEARWAAMFTLLGWDWEYEPFDANGYIPDFVLLGDDPVLIEVKPAVSAQDYRQHIDRLEAALDGSWERDILVVGVSPTPAGMVGPWGGTFPAIGLLGEHGYEGVNGKSDAVWWWDVGRWMRCNFCNSVAFFHDDMSYGSRPCGHYDGDHYMGFLDLDLHSMWGKAHELTRWAGAR